MLLSEEERNIKVKGTILITKRDAKTGKVKEVKKYLNIVTNLGLQMICDALIDHADFADGIDYLALGNDATPAAAVGDTALNNETSRKAITARTRTNQSIELSTFLNTSEANDTHYELGLYGNGAGAGAGSGELFNHLIMTGGETKTNSETWTVEITVSFVNA